MNATQESDPTSGTLSLPPLQNWFMQYSMGRNRHNGEDVDNASTMVMLKNYLFEEVDGEQSTAPLSAYCFMTGFMCVNCTFNLLHISLVFFSVTRLYFLLYSSGALFKRETV